MISIGYNYCYIILQPIVNKGRINNNCVDIDEYLNCREHTWVGEFSNNTLAIVLDFIDPLDELAFRLKYCTGN